MAKMPSSPTDEIKRKIEIIDLIGQYVALKKTGRNYKGLCPFHGEKSPSFIVYPDNESFHCFGCGEHGDIFGFLMKKEGLEFREALERLAAQAGVILQVREPKDEEADRLRDRLRELNRATALFFANYLVKGEAAQVARTYLQTRGISAETTEAFNLGYAPDSWDALKRFLGDRGYSPAEILAAGVVVERNEPGPGGVTGTTNTYDRFRGRLMFPIKDEKGNIVGFGGRILTNDKNQPKYINSPDTPLFDKSGLLYGFDRARTPIKEADEVIIVEGYVDVIIAHQYGMRNVIAPMGTALTERQVALLKKITKNITFCLDADAAGQKAVFRGLEVVNQAMDHHTIPVPTPGGFLRFENKLDAQIKIITLPAGKDPDEVIRGDLAEWQRLAAAALPVVDFYFQSVLQKYDLTNAHDKATIVEELALVIAEIGNSVVKAHYIHQLARTLHLEVRVIQEAVNRAQPGAAGAPFERGRPGPKTQPSQPLKASNSRVMVSPEVDLEEALLGGILRYPRAKVAEEPPGEQDFTRVENRLIFRQFLDAFAQDPESFDRLEWALTLDPTLRDHFETVYQRALLLPETYDWLAAQEIAELLRRLRLSLVSRQLEELQYSLQEASEQNDQDNLLSVLHEIEYLATRRKTLTDPRPSTMFRDDR